MAMSDCTITKEKAQAALAVRRVTSVTMLPQLLGRVFGDIIGYLGELKKKPGGPSFVAYHNMDMQALDVEVGFPVLTNLPGKGDIKPATIPGGNFAKCMHTGPYDALKDTYASFMVWVKEQGAEPTGVVYEFYLNSPEQVPIERLKTRIAF
nr:GyrI-like domain-containing protein [Candidatus Sigynarchaeota archaeon]